MNQQDNETEPTGAVVGESASVRLFSGIFIAIIGVTLCCYITGQGLNAGTSVYIDRLNGSATLAGIGAAVFSFAAIIGRLVSGPLIDSRGRLVVIACGAVVLLVGVLGAAISANLDSIMLWRTLQGLGFSAVTTAAATAAADVLPAERLGEGIGYYGLGQALAMTVGPALAIALVTTDPPENLYWGLAIASGLSLCLCVFCRYERNPERLPKTSTYRRLAHKNASGKLAQRDETEGNVDGAKPKAAEDAAGKRAGFFSKIAEPGALAGGLPMMVISTAFGFGIFFVGLLGTHLGMGNAGIFYTVSAVAMVAVRVSSKAFMDRIAPLKLFAVAVAAGLVCFSLLLAVTLMPDAESGREAMFYIAGFFYGICLGIALPVNQTVAVKNSKPERWGAANGLFMLLFYAGIGTASVVWGITNDLMGFSFTIGCTMVLIALSLGVAFLTYPKSSK